MQNFDAASFQNMRIQN